MKPSLEFLGIKLKNPLVLASGLLGTTGASLAAVAAAGAGAVTLKSAWLQRHEGHPNPTVIHLGGGNLINAVGLPHGGVTEAKTEIESFRKLSRTPLFASVAAGSVGEYIETVAEIAKLKPKLIEVNISCPNVENEFGKPFEHDLELTKDLIVRAKENCGNIPLAIKISRNVRSVTKLAKTIESAGADAITAINTVGPGMLIDIETAKPILANKVGGLSGPAIRPLAVKAVFDIYKAVQIPIIGTGGVSNARDVIEMLQAGATLVGIGSAVIDGAKVFRKIAREMKTWCEEHDIEDITELIGAAHSSNVIPADPEPVEGESREPENTPRDLPAEA
ncbi:MAG: dihydroorotate dehydrogenase [Patescibacteria group bacterium]